MDYKIIVFVITYIILKNHDIFFFISSNTNLPRKGEVCVEPSFIYLPKKIIKKWEKIKSKLCYLQYAIIAYSDFFINFNIFSWIYDFCYHYITNLMLNFYYFPSNVMSFLSLMFASFLRFLSLKVLFFKFFLNKISYHYIFINFILAFFEMFFYIFL